MAENTLQFQWIVTIEGNLDAMYPAAADVFVAGDLFWYPVQGEPAIRVAPDVLVAFGRPKGHRLSYRQWVEGGVAPQVVFEILSPGNTDPEMDEKFAFYDSYGVEEYYVYDPDGRALEGWRRVGGQLHGIPVMHGWVSPRLGITFDLSGDELVIFGPDGRRFLTFMELSQRADQERRDKELAEQRAEQERRDKELAEQRAEQERLRAEESRRRAEGLAAQLRALGIEPNPPQTNGSGAG
jgi:Uma2 family endonuclease